MAENRQVSGPLSIAIGIAYVLFLALLVGRSTQRLVLSHRQSKQRKGPLTKLRGRRAS